MAGTIKDDNLRRETDRPVALHQCVSPLLTAHMAVREDPKGGSSSPVVSSYSQYCFKLPQLQLRVAVQSSSVARISPLSVSDNVTPM